MIEDVEIIACRQKRLLRIGLRDFFFGLRAQQKQRWFIGRLRIGIERGDGHRRLARVNCFLGERLHNLIGDGAIGRLAAQLLQ